MITIYQVGGSVRDKFLGLKAKDLDYAVEAPSWEAMREYIESKGKIYLETPEYFTIRAHVEGLGDADFVLCRKDGTYEDGRRPTSVSMGSIHADLARRDFTVNAIAIETSTNTVLDPFAGRQDLEHRRLACVGNPFDRFNEDALRMLRALRFSVTKGLWISDEVDAALKDQDLLDKFRDKISQDRKKDELHKMLKFNTLRTLTILECYPGIRTALFKAQPLWMEASLKER